MDNKQVAAIFYEVADILDLQGVSFKPNSYRRAARSIEALEEDISKIAAGGRLNEIAGVGESVAKKIQEILQTGQLSYLVKLRSQIPPGLLRILSIPDVGPKTAMMLNKELGIENLDQLRKAAEEHKLRSLKGFGEKTETLIQQGIGLAAEANKRMLWAEADEHAQAILGILEFLKSL